MVSVRFLSFKLFYNCIPVHKIHFTRRVAKGMRGERRQGRTRRRNAWYVGIEKLFVKTFATVLLTSLVPDSPTWINFAFHRKAGRDILSSQRTCRQYIVCYNDNLHFHVFSDHCTIHLCLGVFVIVLFSSRWMGITYLTTKLVLLSTLIEYLDSRTFLIEGVSYDLPSWYNCL